MTTPEKIYIPVELRKRIEALRNYGGSGGTTFSEYVVALLEMAVATYEETTEAMKWDESIKVVPDPTMPEGWVKIVDERTGKGHLMRIEENEDGSEVVATSDDDTIRFRMTYDTRTGAYDIKRDDT